VIKPTIGRFVHYRLRGADGIKRGSGELRPAVITAVFPDEFGPGTFGVNLHVFSDGSNDFKDGREGFHVYSSQLTDTAERDGTCRWPERDAS
jgi:hypothetical protein